MGFLDDLLARFHSPKNTADHADTRLTLGELLVKGELNEQQTLDTEAAVIRETDNSPRPQDGDQALAVAPPPEMDVASDG